jgi:hypothetical protein
MIDHLSSIVEDFPGSANQTRCFSHTLNLSAKAILKQFDIPKAKSDGVLDEATQALAELAEDLDLEERVEQETREIEEDGGEDEPLHTWDNFREGLADDEIRELEESVQPVRSMLVKVR